MDRWIQERPVMALFHEVHPLGWEDSPLWRVLFFRFKTVERARSRGGDPFSRGNAEDRFVPDVSSRSDLFFLQWGAEGCGPTHPVNFAPWKLYNLGRS